MNFEQIFDIIANMIKSFLGTTALTAEVKVGILAYAALFALVGLTLTIERMRRLTLILLNEGFKEFATELLDRRSDRVRDLKAEVSELREQLRKTQAELVVTTTERDTLKVDRDLIERHLEHVQTGHGRVDGDGKVMFLSPELRAAMNAAGSKLRATG